LQKNLYINSTLEKEYNADSLLHSSLFEIVYEEKSKQSSLELTVTPTFLNLFDLNGAVGELKRRKRRIWTFTHYVRIFCYVTKQVMVVISLQEWMNLKLVMVNLRDYRIENLRTRMWRIRTRNETNQKSGSLFSVMCWFFSNCIFLLGFYIFFNRMLGLGPIVVRYSLLIMDKTYVHCFRCSSKKTVF
jgi:hypothetical protein